MENAVLAPKRATTLELFFDLVFVFTITQITQILDEASGFAGYGRAFLVLTVIWWMYAAYVWLTSNLELERAAPQLFLLSGMAGFFLIALSVPGSFGDDQIVIAIAYLWVVAVHTAMFASHTGPSSAQAIRRIAPFNVAAGLLVATGSFLPGELTWVGWAGAVLVLVLSSVLGLDRGFTIHPGHFVERHGLVLIVVLGESLVAIGKGASGIPIRPNLIGAVIGALALTATLWWSYFHRDDVRAEQALINAVGDRRARLALGAYGYGYLIMLGGIIVLASGLEEGLAHLGEAPHQRAVVNQAAGVAIYLIGETLFRRILGLARGTVRIVTAVATLATIPFGLEFGVVPQMWALLAIMVVMLALEEGKLDG